MRQINSILIIDDDDDDRELFCEAVGIVSAATLCHQAINGLEALEMLKKTAPLPDLIFLDLNMPKLNGTQCLAQIKQIEEIKKIPVFIYSTSNFKKDKEETINLGASGFILKPTNFDSLCKEIFAAFSI